MEREREERRETREREREEGADLGGARTSCLWFTAEEAELSQRALPRECDGDCTERKTFSCSVTALFESTVLSWKLAILLLRFFSFLRQCSWSCWVFYRSVTGRHEYGNIQEQAELQWVPFGDIRL